MKTATFSVASLLLVCLSTSAFAQDCVDDFRGGSSVILRRECGDPARPFSFPRYDQSANVPNPGTSPFFLSAVTGNPSCSLSEFIRVQASSQLVINYYTRNPNNAANQLCALSYYAEESLDSVTLTIDNSNNWRTATLNVGVNGDVLVALECLPLDSNALFAVGMIRIFNIPGGCPAFSFF